MTDTFRSVIIKSAAHMCKLDVAHMGVGVYLHVAQCVCVCGVVSNTLFWSAYMKGDTLNSEVPPCSLRSSSVR